MATEPKRWPNNMAWARDNAAEACQLAVRHLRPLAAHKDIAVMATANAAMVQLQIALRNLEQAGASTRPMDD